MDKFSRGSKIAINTIFRGSSGNLLEPSSANIVFSYLDVASCWPPLDGSDRLTSTSSLASVSTVTGVWSTTWNSAVASTGLVFWTAYPSTNISAVNNGQFELVGNLANFPAIPSTAG